MGTFGGIVLLCILLIDKTTTVLSNTNTDNRKVYQPTKFYSNDGVIGVASVATMRNGKTSGLQMFMIPEENKDKSNIMYEHKFGPIEAPLGRGVVVENSAEIFPRNGKYSSLGGVKIYPTLIETKAAKEDLGNIFKINKIVDSSAIFPDTKIFASPSTGYTPKSNVWSSMNVPIVSDRLFQSSSIVESPVNLESLLIKHFRKLTPIRPVLSNELMYPNFDPFMNFWR